MDIKNIINCLQTNGISYPSEFSNIEKDGCITVFSRLLQTNLDHIDKMVRYGSNNGFDADIKNNISKLVKLTCKITQEKNAKKYEKYVAESTKIYGEVEKEIINKEGQIDMVGKVNEHIDNYIAGMEVLLGMEVAEDRKPVLIEGIEKCKKIKKVLSETLNTSTNSALGYAKDIIVKLQTWADIVANKMHDSSDLVHLDDALNIANKWKSNYETVKKGGLFSKGNKASEKDIEELNFKEDDLSMTGKSKVVLREIEIFKQNLGEYKKAVCDGSVEELEKTLEERKAEKAKLEADKKELVVKFQNGEISKEDLFDECMDIDEQVEDLDEDIEEISFDLKEKKQDDRSTEKVLKTLESLNNQVLRYKADPVYFTLLGEELDFAKLTKVMRGAGTSVDLDYVFGVQDILERVKIRRKKVENDLAARLRERQGIKKQRREEEMAHRREEMGSRLEAKNAKKAAMDDYLANLLGQTQKPETVENANVQTQESVAEENTRIALGDDDL